MINFKHIIHKLTFFVVVVVVCLIETPFADIVRPFQCTHLCEKQANRLFDFALLPHHIVDSSQRIEIKFIGHTETKMKRHALSHFSSLPRLSTPPINIQSENANAIDYRANISSSTIQSHLLFINE